MSIVHIIDVGSGNLTSVANAIWRAGGDPVMASKPEHVLAADRIVLPGVGAAGTFLQRIREAGLEEPMTEAIQVRARPFLGICVGMQVLGERLFEFGEHRGFGWFRGDVVHLREVIGPEDRVPHMGWSSLDEGPAGKGTPLTALRRSAAVYFCHSFTFVTPDEDIVAARIPGETPVVAALSRGSVLATQFHPEKSQDAGRRLFQSFLEWTP